MKKCPKCGKKMMTSPGWPGIWTCPDFQTALNDKAPFKYKCYGMHVSNAAVNEFSKECELLLAARN